jgi:hypothetical protein
MHMAQQQACSGEVEAWREERNGRLRLAKVKRGATGSQFLDDTSHGYRSSGRANVGCGVTGI